MSTTSRTSYLAFEETELQTDSKYKLYVTSVDKALKSFEYTSEWADLISALGKLNKILSNHQRYPVIPRRMKISKRLAQCLHPALPSGVHLKALETYDIMFKTMGTSRLSRELFIYSSGLFPVLGHAATNVKPSLLTIYENHFVPLGEKLIPGLSGFLSGILPGLEEGTDYYDRTNHLMEQVCQGVGEAVFYTCLWDCLSSNAAVRLPAILFILSHFDRHLTTKDQVFLMGNDSDILVNGLCSCFQDESVLIQRSALDFLLVAFPLHDGCLSIEERRVVIRHALVTLLRRDMSLNRRLFAWLLGSEVITVATNASKSLLLPPSSPTAQPHDVQKSLKENRYFETHSKDLLVSAIKNMLANVTSNDPHDLRPYRILISLLDKSDVGPIILDDILFDVFRLLYLCWQNPGNAASNGAELLKSANLLFSSLEPRYLWQYVGLQFHESCRTPRTQIESHKQQHSQRRVHNVKPVDSGDATLMEVCDVISFLLDSLSLEIYSDTFGEHLPELFVRLISSLTDYCDLLDPNQANISLRLCLRILSKIGSPTLLCSSGGDRNTSLQNICTNANRPSKKVEKVHLIGEHSSRDKSGSGESSEPNCGNVESTDIDSDDHVNYQNTPDEKEYSTMGECLKRYKKFYVTFVYVIRLKLDETRSPSHLCKALLIKSNRATVRLEAKRLESLLLKVLGHGDQQYRSSFEKDPSDLDHEHMNLKSTLEDDMNTNDDDRFDCFDSCSTKETIGSEWREAFENASKLLIELSTFETSLASNRRSLQDLSKTSEEDDENELNDENMLPDWLQSLIVCACWLGNDCIPLQLIAISTLLDLALLCRPNESLTIASTIRDSNDDRASDKISHDGSAKNGSDQNGHESNRVITVVFVPLLTLEQLIFIEQRTIIFQVIVHRLWSHFECAVYKTKCAQLIFQLHNTLRIPDLIERCIGKSLSHQSHQYELRASRSLRKFIKLWHMRGEMIKRDNSSPRVDDSLYRCMLKVLDNLGKNENNYARLETESWLFHSLLRNDIERLMEPLLLILLERKTARIGISHAKIQQRVRCSDVVSVVSVGRVTNEITNTTTSSRQSSPLFFIIYGEDGNVVAYHNTFKKNVARSDAIGEAATPITSYDNVDDDDDEDDEDNKRQIEMKKMNEEKRNELVEPIDASIRKSVSQTDFESNRDKDELENNDGKYNTLPWSKDKRSGTRTNGHERRSSPKRNEFHSCSSSPSLGVPNNEVIQTRRSPSTSDCSRLTEETAYASSFESGNRSGVDINIKICRPSVSDDSSLACVPNEGNEDESLAVFDNELVRSRSFSGERNSTNDARYFATNFASAKHMVEDIVKEIVQRVINEKEGLMVNGSDVVTKLWSSRNHENENDEEVDSAISCTSGASSVTLEYDVKEPSVVSESIGSSTICSSYNFYNEEGEEAVNGDLIKPAIDEEEKEEEAAAAAPQMYSHMLLYCEVYDTRRTLYMLEKLRDILSANAKAFLLTTLTNMVSNGAASASLLVKHRNSIFGKGFEPSSTNAATVVISEKNAFESCRVGHQKSTTYLEMLITVCFYYVRGYYPNLGEERISRTEIIANKRVQIECIELLTSIFFHLRKIVACNAHEIRQLLNRCKVQKITLHCALCCLLDDACQRNVHVFIKDIVEFNKSGNGTIETAAAHEYDYAFQINFLKLLLSLIVLENDLYEREECHEETVVNRSSNAEQQRTANYDLPYDEPVIRHPLFFDLLKKLLEASISRRAIHERVISFVIATLPYANKLLAKISVNVVRSLCTNIETTKDMFVKSAEYRARQRVPINYMVTIMDALTVICHYCLFDFCSSSLSPKWTSVAPVETTTTKIFKNLFQMYADFPNCEYQSLRADYHLSASCHREAKNKILEELPKILTSISSLWSCICKSGRSDYENEAGNVLVLRNQILNFLNPIAVHESHRFFTSIATVWKEKAHRAYSTLINDDNHYSDAGYDLQVVHMNDTRQQQQPQPSPRFIPKANEEQLILVRLLSSLTSVTPEILIGSVHRIIKGQSQSDKTNLNAVTDMEICVLEVLVRYIETITLAKLTECWNWLILLVREVNNLNARSQFLMCAVVDYFVRRLPNSPEYCMEKKDFKDLHDIIVKLVEICTQIAGACLEQTTWLRRNLAVKDTNGVATSLFNPSVLSNGILFGKDTDKQGDAVTQYSVHAQLLLAEVLIPLLDSIFTNNQDKEKLVTILINVMSNVTPYLKNHTKKNTNNFYACSSILATISSYAYAKKAWKKEVMDLLLDANLFQMEFASLQYWKTIVANLMCQDNTSTFRDLLGRVSVAPSNALNLFSSKDQEYELRMQLLKRLAFVILCCEHDQFHKHMPEIQEKLADSLKVPQNTPGIQAHVFFCFRVLLLRMSAHHVTSLWPVIVTEMVQVMLQMEYELSAVSSVTDSEELSNFQPTRVLSSPELSWMSSSSSITSVSVNGNHPHWLQLQLAAAKLLKLAVQLPANRLPQFQMYRWAFVGNIKQPDSIDSTYSRNNIGQNFSVDFVPHVTRIANLMNDKFGKIREALEGTLLLPSFGSVKMRQELHTFFATLSAGKIDVVADDTELEREIELDFIEPLPNSSLSTQSK